MIVDTLVSLVSELILVFVFLNAITQMLEKKILLTKKDYFIISIFTILLLINNLYNLAGLKILFTFLLCFITCKLIFKTNIKDSLFYTLIYVILGMIIEIFVSVFLLSQIKNIESLNQNIYFKSFLSIIFSFITYYVFQSKKVLVIIKKLKEIINNSKFFYFVILLINIILVICMYLLGEAFNNIYFIFFVITSCIFMLISFNIIINDKYNYSVLEQKNKNLKDSYTAYAETIDDCKEIKHNLKNDLYYLKLNLPKEHQESINELIIKYNTKYDWINRIDEVPEGLQGIIYLKINEAKEKKVKIYLNTKENFKTPRKDYLDLCNVVGILFDNAIDASNNTKNKVIEVIITQNKNEIKMRIYNNFKNNVDVNKIGKKNYSTKEYKSGLGLNYINKLKNNNIKVSYKIVNNLFITDLIYKEK
ncbi:MAG: GHKL domain-containing protein [Bacilli bacterium]|nr:GHKL domain-containing protein [Bacilli bacterium]